MILIKATKEKSSKILPLTATKDNSKQKNITRFKDCAIVRFDVLRNFQFKTATFQSCSMYYVISDEMLTVSLLAAAVLLLSFLTT